MRELALKHEWKGRHYHGLKTNSKEYGLDISHITENLRYLGKDSIEAV